MNISFSWGSGKMVVDAESALDGMTITSFRKWVKLFSIYGEPEDKLKIQDVCASMIQCSKSAVEKWDAEIADLNAKHDRKVPTQLTRKYCREQAALKKKHRNGEAARLKRLERLSEILKEVLNQ